MKLNADLTLRASSYTHELELENFPSPGVQRRRLEYNDDKPPVEHVTTVVRITAQSSFAGHVHQGGEEFLAPEGIFSDHQADYPAGYYVRNPKGTGHAPHSDNGCTILVKLWQMYPDDQQQLSIDTNDKDLWRKDSRFGQVLPLFDGAYETVSMMK